MYDETGSVGNIAVTAALRPRTKLDECWWLDSGGFEHWMT